MRLGVFQFAPVYGDVAGNTRRILGALSGAEADLVVLPELPFTGYAFGSREELLRLAEEPEGSPAVEALAGACREGDMHVVAGFAERSGERVYNSALLVGPEGPEAAYRKLHLFDREKEWFDPGDAPPAVHEVRGARVGMMVCFDWVFPEVARTLALKGADVLCHPANLVLAYCQDVMLARCTENLVFAATANRTGGEERCGMSLSFSGRSQVAAPGGRLLFRAGPAGEVLRVVDVDPEEARDKMMTPRNHVLEDRRPELYR